MGDDWIVRVKQLSQYPLKAAAAPTDALLLQEVGIGGPYAYTTPAGLLKALATVPDTMAFGGPLTVAGSITATGPLTAGALTGTSLALDGSTFTPAANALALNTTLTVGRDPLAPMEVATVHYITANAVTSFNGRNGAIALLPADLDVFGFAPLESPALTGCPTGPTFDWRTCTDLLATTAFVHAAIHKTMIATIQEGMVFTFNGRKGDVCLNLHDIVRVGGMSVWSAQLRGRPTAPSPGQNNRSERIATTRWVGWQLDQVEADIAKVYVYINDNIDISRYATLDYVAQIYAPLASPVLTGYPQGPTAPVGTNTGQLATTAFVMAAVTAATAGVVSFNGRTGIITLQAQDLVDLGAAFLNNPQFTGVPTVPTAAPGTSSNQIASTEFVLGEIASVDAGVVNFNGRSGFVSLTWADVSAVGGAPLASPALSGIPTAPTATQGTSTTQLATTAFVQAALAAAPGGVSSFNGRTGAITFTSGDISAAGGAVLAGPAFTGVPTAPTAVLGTSTTQLATTAFVQAALATIVGGVSSFNTRAGAVTLTTVDVKSAAGAIFRQAGTPPALSTTNQTLWFDQVGGQLYVQYVDPTSSALSWVIANSPQALPIPDQSTLNQPTLFQPRVMGVTDGSNAGPGEVGEVLVALQPAAINSPAGTWTIALTLVLTPGDWDVNSLLSVTASNNIQIAIGTSPTDYAGLRFLFLGSLTQVLTAAPYLRVSSGSSTTVYLFGYGGTAAELTSGQIHARRVR